MISDFPFPAVNATLNACAAVLLSGGFIAIKYQRVQLHRLCMISAFIISVVFLLSYLTYHWQTGANTPFAGTGAWRYLYYTLLITHVILAIIIVPLVIYTFSLALRQQFTRHRHWARWTFPLWYYVSVTGVLVYFFLYQWFPPAA